MFNSLPESRSKKPLNCKKTIGKENHMGHEISGLTISQPKQKCGKENRDIKGQSLPSKGRLMISYNNRKRIPSLLRQKGKSYKVVKQKMDRLANEIIFSDKLAMQVYYQDCL